MLGIQPKAGSYREVPEIHLLARRACIAACNISTALIMRGLFGFRVARRFGLLRFLELVGQFGVRVLKLLVPIRQVNHHLVQLIVVLLQVHQRKLQILQSVFVVGWASH